MKDNWIYNLLVTMSSHLSIMYSWCIGDPIVCCNVCSAVGFFVFLYFCVCVCACLLKNEFSVISESLNSIPAPRCINVVIRSINK